MPHVTLQGPVDLKKYYADYEPVSQGTGAEILKLQEIFSNRSHDMLLIEALTVEGGPPNRFMAQVRTKDGKTTVRFYPGTDPEKTPGAKKILVMIARQLKDQGPEIQYGATNLKEYL